MWVRIPPALPIEPSLPREGFFRAALDPLAAGWPDCPFDVSHLLPFRFSLQAAEEGTYIPQSYALKLTLS
jgi:hypothetical protein